MGEKWGWVIYGLFVYKMLTGCGENVDFMPINSPYFLCPTKVKQHRREGKSFASSSRDNFTHSSRALTFV